MHALAIRTSLLILAGTLGAVAASAQPTQTDPSGMQSDSLRTARTASIVAAERTFRADVLRLGVRDGFLEHFADDGVLFRPGPVNAKEFLRAQEAQPGLLEWEPAFAEVAADDDLGFTTGPWSYRPTDADAVVASGFYATVWKRFAGEWRAVVDHGVNLGRPASVPVPQEVASPGTPSVPSANRTLLVAGRAQVDPKELLVLDHHLSIAAGELEGVTRFLRKVATDARFLRPGTLPIAGMKTIEDLIMSNPGGVSYTPSQGDVSTSADLGYTWGSYGPGMPTDGGSIPDPIGVYLHVWRHEQDGWKLLFELLAPNPPETSKQ